MGSNLGDRLHFLQTALQELHMLPGVTLERVSSVYESPALVVEGTAPQPDYLNAVCRGYSELSPEKLLEHCLSIELKLGRVRSSEAIWQARTIDLDIINWGQRSVSSSHLTLPHPRIATRRFVLDPLVEIDPNLQLPTPYNCTVEYLHSRCPDTLGIRKTIFELTIPDAG